MLTINFGHIQLYIVKSRGRSPRFGGLSLTGGGTVTGQQ